MATIVLRNGWNEAEEYSNVTSVTFLNPEGEEVTFYENGSGGGGSGGGGTGGVGVQADWLQISPYHPSYINNRPFYIYYDVIVEPDAKEFYVDEQHNLCVTELQLNEPILENQRYIVYWKDCGYLCEVQKIEGDLILGDSSLITNEAQKESPEPFVGYFIDGVNKLIIGTKEQTEIALVGLLSDKEKVQTIDKKFLPDDIVGLDEDRLAEYLTTNGYSVKKDIEDAISGTKEWVEETFVSEKDLETLLKTVATKAELAAAREAIEATILSYKEEVAKTYATKVELADSQADWEIEDKSNPAAIKRKPFGIYPDIIPITDDLAPTPFEIVEGGYRASLGIILDNEEKYTLLWNNTAIPCELGVATIEGITLNADGTVFVTTPPEEGVKLGLRLTDNIYRLDTKFLKKDEILEGMASQQYVKEQIEAIPQVDWDVDVSSNKSYIKNRPFYLNEVKFQSNLTFKKSSYNNNYQCPISFPLDGQLIMPGQKLTVVWDGITYPDCAVRRIELIKSSTREIIAVGCVIGNSRLWETSKISVYEDDYKYSYSDLPFCMQINNYAQVGSNELDLKSVVTKSTNSSHSLLIYRNLKKLDKIFLPEEALKVQEQADWTETNSSSPSFIKHKPEIAEQKPSNWTQTNPYDVTYIQNKPFGENDDLMGEHELDFVYDEEVQAWIADLNIELGLEDLYDSKTSVTITWDGQKHTQTPAQGSWYAEGMGHGAVLASLGNTSIIPRNPIVWKVSTSNPSGTSLPYLITAENKVYTYEEGTSHKVGIVLTTKTVGRRIDKKWLPTDIIYKENYLQPDWNQTNTKANDYIKNKPTIPTLVQPDWNQTDTTADDYIKNKPDFSAIQADWAEQDPAVPTYIQNIPSVLRNPSGSTDILDYSVNDRAIYTVKGKEIAIDYINTDWEETDPLKKGFIFNKPFGENLSLFKGVLNKTYNYNENEQSAIGMFATAQSLPLPSIGKIYKLIINQVVYSSKAKPLSDLSLGNYTGCYFGNAALAGEGVDTKESYCVVVINERSYLIQCYLKTFTNPGAIDLEINEYSPIKKIDKKYLPDECFSGGASEEKISALEKLVQAQADLIAQMQQQLQDLTQRVERLEQGYTPPSGPGASVNGDTLEVEGSVADETLTIQGVAVSNETLVLGGGSGTQAEVEGEELTINGLIMDETLNLNSGAVIGETLGLTGDVNTVIEETVSTTGTINDDILSSSGVVTTDETWEVN